MSFNEILNGLIQQVKGAEAAVLSDYDGEPVAEAIAKGTHFDRYTIQLLGAQLRAPLNYFEKIHRDVQLDHPRSISIKAQERSILIWLLSDRYFVLLSVRNGYGTAQAEFQLKKTADLILQEM